MSARAANVSRQLRLAGFTLVNSDKRFHELDGTRIRVSQVGDEVRVRVRSNDEGEMALTASQLVLGLQALGYSVRTSNNFDPFARSIWARRTS